MSSSNHQKAQVISAFTEDQASRLTGLSKYQLKSWDKQGLISPSFGEKNRRVAFSRIYSFTDLKALRVLNQLRNVEGVTLRHLREVKKTISPLNDRGWCDKMVYVLNKEVVIEDHNQKKLSALSGQGILGIPLQVVHDEMTAAVTKMRERSADSVGKFDQKKYVARNKLIIAGTRIKVSTIKEFLDEGYSTAAILQEYPSLQEEDVNAVYHHKDSA